MKHCRIDAIGTGVFQRLVHNRGIGAWQKIDVSLLPIIPAPFVQHIHLFQPCMVVIDLEAIIQIFHDREIHLRPQSIARRGAGFVAGILGLEEGQDFDFDGIVLGQGDVRYKDRK